MSPIEPVPQHGAAYVCLEPQTLSAKPGSALIQSMPMRSTADLIKSAMIVLAGISGLAFDGPAQAFPVESPTSFKGYLNSRTDWNDGYEITFKSVSECYRTYKNNGQIKAYVCKNGEVSRMSPKGEKSTCKVDLVRLTRKGKLKLTTARCQYY